MSDTAKLEAFAQWVRDELPGSELARRAKEALSDEPQYPPLVVEMAKAIDAVVDPVRDDYLQEADAALGVVIRRLYDNGGSTPGLVSKLDLPESFVQRHLGEEG